MGKTNILEKAFNETKCYLKTKDRRLKASKYELALARQEFMAELKEQTIEWFNKRAMEFLDGTKE